MEPDDIGGPEDKVICPMCRRFFILETGEIVEELKNVKAVGKASWTVCKECNEGIW